jgi:hypothetical protein
MPSLRSNFSQAASILLWKAGLDPGLAAGSASAPTLIAAPSFPVLQAVAPPETVDTPVGPAALPPIATAETAPAALPIGAAGDTAVLTAAIPAPPFATEGAAPAGASGPSPLPAPFHPLVASIRTHAATRKPGEAEPTGTELMLHPADLGRIRFAMSGSGAQLAITVAAENPETLRLLQSHATDLRAELAREGFGQAALSFTGPGPGDGGRQEARNPFAAPPGDAESAGPGLPTLSPPPARALSRTGGGLDLRL